MRRCLHIGPRRIRWPCQCTRPASGANTCAKQDQMRVVMRKSCAVPPLRLLSHLNPAALPCSSGNYSERRLAASSEGLSSHTATWRALVGHLQDSDDGQLVEDKMAVVGAIKGCASYCTYAVLHILRLAAGRKCHAVARQTQWLFIAHRDEVAAAAGVGWIEVGLGGYWRATLFQGHLLALWTL